MKRYMLLPVLCLLVLLICQTSGLKFTEAAIKEADLLVESADTPVNTPANSPVDSPASFNTAFSDSSDPYLPDRSSTHLFTYPPIPASTPTPSPAETTESPKESPTPAPRLKIRELPDWYANSDKGIRVPVLMYHNLLDGSQKGDGLNVSEEMFENQLAELKAYGYNTVFFGQLYDHYMNGAELPENPIIITFDDGYESNYTLGYPVLKKYGMNACVFMITNAIGASNYMNADELQEISSSGLMEIQSHGTSHDYYLSSMKKEEMAEELLASKKKLELITGRAVNVFCYPFGKYSQGLVDELVAQNYVFSFTTGFGCASKKVHPFLLPRIRVYGTDTGEELRERIEELTGRKTRIMAPSPDPSAETVSEPVPEPAADKEPEITPVSPVSP